MKIDSIQQLRDEQRLSATQFDLQPSPPASQVDIRIKMMQEQSKVSLYSNKNAVTKSTEGEGIAEMPEAHEEEPNTA